VRESKQHGCKVSMNISNVGSVRAIYLVQRRSLSEDDVVGSGPSNNNS
jgi:hypothetical protein